MSLLLLLITHLIADFFVQTKEQQENKWWDNGILLDHTITYTLCFIPFVVIYFNPAIGILFLFITLYMHTVTDRFTSILTHKYFSKKEYKKGFQIVGIDQTLHYLQLYGLLKILEQNPNNMKLWLPL